MTAVGLDDDVAVVELVLEHPSTDQVRDTLAHVVLWMHDVLDAARQGTWA